ncbi:MAG: Rieske 2Fe-2S domain-containing protein [Myxococcaceae bacterium]
MTGFVTACPLAELPPGEKRVVTIGDRELALVNVDGEIFAVDNDCPHRGGPLGHGDLQGHVLHCPLHAWPFDLRTGVCTLFPDARIRTWEVRITEGMILVATTART